MNEIERWRKRLQRTLNDMPKGYWLYSACGTLHIMRCDEDGRHMFKGTGIDPDSVVATMDHVDIDGGDW